MYSLHSQEMAKLRNELKQMESDWKCQLANVQATRTLNKMEDFFRKCKGVQSEKNSSLHDTTICRFVVVLFFHSKVQMIFEILVGLISWLTLFLI